MNILIFLLSIIFSFPHLYTNLLSYSVSKFNSLQLEFFFGNHRFPKVRWFSFLQKPFQNHSLETTTSTPYLCIVTFFERQQSPGNILVLRKQL